jgi:hypothetical protein
MESVTVGLVTASWFPTNQQCQRCYIKISTCVFSALNRSWRVLTEAGLGYIKFRFCRMSGSDNAA